MSVYISDEEAVAAYPAHWHDRTDHLLARVPSYMHAAFCRWVLWGIKPGDFLDAVACGDLFRAVRNADDENMAAIPQWVKLFYNGSPAACFGSEKLAARWMEKGGLLGRCAECDSGFNIPGEADSGKVEVDGGPICKGCAYRRADMKHASQIMGG